MKSKCWNCFPCKIGKASPQPSFGGRFACLRLDLLFPFSECTSPSFLLPKEICQFVCSTGCEILADFKNNCQHLRQTGRQRAVMFLSLSLKSASSAQGRNWLCEIRAGTRHFLKCCLWTCTNVADCTSHVFCCLQERKKTTRHVRLRVLSVCYGPP